MFRTPNPFEELVNKATDENLTTENWDLNLALCDRLASNDESDARKCLAAIQKRILNRNANVQLYAITLTDTLSKNCGDAVHHEIASRAFMQTLSKVVQDPNTHKLVKQRILRTLMSWRDEFSKDDTLGLVAETVHELREEYYDLDEEPSPRTQAHQSEEDELQRVLALSLHDQGGRGTNANHSSSSGSGPSTSFVPQRAASPPLPTATTDRSSTSRFSMPNPYDIDAAQDSASVDQGESSVMPVAQPTTTQSAASSGPDATIARRTASARPAFVRALYDFEPDEPGELAFRRGDVVRVLDSVYEQWWRGELRHQVGIFPVNYVEAMPDTTPDMIHQEQELERMVFTNASDIHVLHARLQQLRPTDNFVDDDELQDLYQRSLALRPKIIRLMETYHTKVQELRSLNDKFVRARSMLDDLIQQHVSTPISAEPSKQDTAAALATAAPAASGSVSNVVPQEDEKRRLFERARAEVEAYQREQQARSALETASPGAAGAAGLGAGGRSDVMHHANELDGLSFGPP